jgi:hypothetical protein
MADQRELLKQEQELFAEWQQCGAFAQAERRWARTAYAWAQVEAERQLCPTAEILVPLLRMRLRDAMALLQQTEGN